MNSSSWLYLLDNLHDVFIVQPVVFSCLHRLVLHARAPDPGVLEVRQNILIATVDGEVGRKEMGGTEAGRTGRWGHGKRGDRRQDGVGGTIVGGGVLSLCMVVVV